MTQPIHGYFHVACMGPRWQALTQAMLERVRDSGLLAFTEQLHIGVTGTAANYKAVQKLAKAFGQRVLVSWHGEDVTQYEYPTLQLLESYCRSCIEPEPLVYYLHTKGVSKMAADGSENPLWHYWREWMLEHVVDRWQECLSALKHGFDCAGSPWHEGGGHKHYSGTFWWARGGHIRTLPTLASLREKPVRIWSGHSDQETIRLQCEMWIGMSKTVKPFDFGHQKNTLFLWKEIAQKGDQLRPWTGDSALARFEKTMCISLANRTERRAHAQAQFDSVGAGQLVEWWDGVPARQMNLILANQPNPGIAGCLLSHWAILHEAVRRGWQSLVVFEDDIVFEKAFNERLDFLLGQLPADWEVLWLGHYPRKGDASYSDNGHYGQCYSKPLNVYGSHAIAYSRAGIVKMYEAMNAMVATHVDMMLQQASHGMASFCSFPPLVYQNLTGLPSDIHKYTPDGRPTGWEDSRPVPKSKPASTTGQPGDLVFKDGQISLRKVS